MTTEFWMMAAMALLFVASVAAAIVWNIAAGLLAAYVLLALPAFADDFWG